MGNMLDECKVLILLGGMQKNNLKQSNYVQDNTFQGISLSSGRSFSQIIQIKCLFSSKEYGKVSSQEESMATF